jgi:formylglycine-generating enzyme required for sulfatase activity
MKKSIISLLLMVAMLPLMANAEYVQLADGVYQDGTTLYICSGVTSLGDLQVNPSEIYCYATIPPACMSNTFTGYSATLHVPAAGMVSYFTTLYWYNFNNILSDAIEPLSVTMSTAEAELEIGQQLSLSAMVSPGNATPNTVYWSTTDASVATVSSDGTVTAVANGECDILATCVDKAAACHVTVVNPRVTITLDTHEARLFPNHTLTLNATCSPIDVDLAVTSSDLGVAIPRIVNGSIMVVGVAEGTATISVNAADGWGNPDQCVVTVYTELGDTNCDGYINIADVTELIDYLLSGVSSQINLTNADTDKNGSVNIADVTELIDYLLNGIWSWQEDLTFTVNGVSFKMVPVEGGTFMMGATPEQGDNVNDYEKPAHQVTLSSYAIGETEVTQKLWEAVMGNNPSYFKGDLTRPVEWVSWNDCQTFITKLNQMTGEHFRLPTEAEWEFAARGGNKSQGYKYAGSNSIDEVAWYSGNSYGTTYPVAYKLPNELGLYDMSGNVFEWVQDWDGNYSSEAQTNPTGPASGYYRMDRGGSWDQSAECSRVSFRAYGEQTGTIYRIGLRLALGQDISPEPEEHEWVDLGLPSGTLWATCNVGASEPEEYGDYFAWGETEPKEVYSWKTYKWCSGSYNTLTKYCTNSTYGTVDNKMELYPEDDAAYVNWGPEWRMPTIDQLQELINNCTWTWTTQNGVNGRLVTGPNENTLFLPAAGRRWSRASDSASSYGFYWSRVLYSSYSYDAYDLGFYSDDVYWNNGSRSDGFTVRAVRVSQN